MLSIAVFAQTTVIGGIKDNPLRVYDVYAEVKQDTSNSILKEDLDVLKIDVDDYLVSLDNQTTNGDTLFGEFDIPIETVAYVKVGVVARSSTGRKPSLMKVTSWLRVSAREPKPLEVFIEEK